MFEKTIKQLGWYFKGQITTWGVWILEYHYGTKTVDNKTYKVRSKGIQIPDSKANIRKVVAKTKKSYAEIDLKATGYQSRTSSDYKSDLTADLWKAEDASYTCYIIVDESELRSLGFDELKSRVLEPKNYNQYIDIRSYPNGARVASLIGFKVENCLTVEITNAGSENKGIFNVDLFPYNYNREVPALYNIPSHIDTIALAESDCNKYARGVLMKEIALFIDEIIKLQNSSK